MKNLLLILIVKNIVLFGKNGVGKTNILESISLLSPGRGLRNAKNEEIINKNTNTDYGLSANLQFDNNSIKIKKTYLRDETKKSNLFIDDEKSKTADLLNFLRCHLGYPCNGKDNASI
jgi:DNA replication and repair protein RecF